jgi:aspartate/tyrosine/aromatic aminotransferase
LIPFLDIAYQGFGGGMEEDAYAIRAIASAGLPALVSNSFSKIFSCTASASADCLSYVKMLKPPAAFWGS